MEPIQQDKWVFILNPTAGNNYAGTLVSKIETEIKKHHIDGKIEMTEYIGHATELASSNIQQGANYLIAVGGDGTLNEVARAILGHSHVTMGIIPAGTGNDYIQILGFPNRFNEGHWDIFFEKNVIKIDAGTCNTIPFFNGMGLGFDAEVAAQNYIDDGQVKKGGKDKYIWHIVKTLLLYRERSMKIINNGSTHSTDCFINTVSIGRRFAGGFFLTPKAIANDGFLDVCAIDKLNIFQRFNILLKVPKGQHLSHKKVNYYQTDAIKIEFGHKVPFHVDGELHFSSIFEINVLPKAIQTIFNPYGNHFLTIK